MSHYGFHQPITVRYADLDPQGHVNNAVYLSYLEHARIGYFQRLGLWNSDSFLDIGVILAEVRLTYRAPILLGQPIQVGLRTSRLGNKSLVMEYIIEDTRDQRLLSTAETVLVTYDYRQNRTIPIPENWRRAISAFEGLPEPAQNPR